MKIEPLTQQNSPSPLIWNYYKKSYFDKYNLSGKNPVWILNSKGKIFIIVKILNKEEIITYIYDKTAPSGYVPMKHVGYLGYEVKDRCLLLPSYGKYENVRVDDPYKRHGVGMAMLQVAYQFHNCNMFKRDPRNPESTGGKGLLDAFAKSLKKECTMKKITIKTESGKRIVFAEFEIKKRGGKWVVLAHDGKVRGTHDSEETAKRQVRAIYANWKHEALEEANYSLQDVVNNISAVFQYLLWSKFEKKARNNFLSQDTEQSAMLLRQDDTRKKVFSYLAGNLMKIVKDVLVSTFTTRYGIEAAEFDRYFDLRTMASYLSSGKSKYTPPKQTGSTSGTKVETPAPINPQKIDLRKEPQGAYIGEANEKFYDFYISLNYPLILKMAKTLKKLGYFPMDKNFFSDISQKNMGDYTYVFYKGESQSDVELYTYLDTFDTASFFKVADNKVMFGMSNRSDYRRIKNMYNRYTEALEEFDPEEEDWLSKQFDKIEQETAEVTLPDPPSEKEKEDALQPVDSREQQVADSYISEEGLLKKAKITTRTESIEKQVIAFLKKNPNPDDTKVHEFADELNINPDQLEPILYKLATKCTEKKGKPPLIVR